MDEKQTHEVRNVTWQQNDLGWYWRGDLFLNGKQVAVTGNYYNVDQYLPQAGTRDDIILPDWMRLADGE